MPDDIINKVISFITGDSEAASDTDVLLKQLAKEASQNKYAKFYRVKQDEVDVGFANYVFNLYKDIYPLQLFLRDSAKESKIKQINLEAFLDKTVMAVIKRLSADSIAERKRNAAGDLSKLLQDDLASLSAGFDSPRIAQADKCYNLFLAMKNFVFYDFSSLIKKFDPEIIEGDFSAQPKFTPVETSIIAEQIAALASVIPLYDEKDDWKTVFEILKYCKGGMDVIPFAQWNNILASLKDLKQSKILELICKLAAGNPILEIRTNIPHESLSASWLDQKTIEIKKVIAGIAGSQRAAQINSLEQAVFGHFAQLHLNYYTVEREKVLLEKELTNYIYAPALNHLFSFVQLFFSKEINELCDILLVRGQWTNVSASRVMSDAFHDITEIIDEIVQLDNSLDEDGTNGPRLRGALLRVDRDKTQARYIHSIIKSINEEALNIINRAVPSLIVVGKHFKMLMEDCEKKHSELILNWKELGQFSKTPLPERITASYKKINYFVQLMILETKPAEEET